MGGMKALGADPAVGDDAEAIGPAPGAAGGGAAAGSTRVMVSGVNHSRGNGSKKPTVAPPPAPVAPASASTTAVVSLRCTPSDDDVPASASGAR